MSIQDRDRGSFGLPSLFAPPGSQPSSLVTPPFNAVNVAEITTASVGAELKVLATSLYQAQNCQSLLVLIRKIDDCCQLFGQLHADFRNCFAPSPVASPAVELNANNLLAVDCKITATNLLRLSMRIQVSSPSKPSLSSLQLVGKNIMSIVNDYNDRKLQSPRTLTQRLQTLQALVDNSSPDIKRQFRDLFSAMHTNLVAQIDVVNNANSLDDADVVVFVMILQSISDSLLNNNNTTNSDHQAKVHNATNNANGSTMTPTSTTTTTTASSSPSSSASGLVLTQLPPPSTSYANNLHSILDYCWRDKSSGTGERNGATNVDTKHQRRYYCQQRSTPINCKAMVKVTVTGTEV